MWWCGADAPSAEASPCSAKLGIQLFLPWELLIPALFTKLELLLVLSWQGTEGSVFCCCQCNNRLLDLQHHRNQECSITSAEL